MNLNELRDKTYKIACEHGFHDTELSNKHFLCQIILGIGWDANKMGKWFWQSNKDRDLVILKNWVTVEK